MKRWLWAAAACLVGTSAANAEYAIIRVWLNKDKANPNAGQFGGPPGRHVRRAPGRVQGGNFGPPRAA